MVKVIPPFTETRRTEPVPGPDYRHSLATPKGIFRSGGGGSTWEPMELPATLEGGLHLGGQAGLRLSTAADRTNHHIVYVGGLG